MEISLEGIFRAKVLDNNDPWKAERLLISAQGIHDPEVGVWAEHISYSNRMSGDIPEIGTTVFVQFIRDFNLEYNPNDCVWIGQSNLMI